MEGGKTEKWLSTQRSLPLLTGKVPRVILKVATYNTNTRSSWWKLCYYGRAFFKIIFDWLGLGSLQCSWPSQYTGQYKQRSADKLGTSRIRRQKA